jgi:hypothetical protein
VEGWLPEEGVESLEVYTFEKYRLEERKGEGKREKEERGELGVVTWYFWLSILLQLFLPTNTPASYLSSVEHAKDPLFAPSYHSLKGAKEEGYVYIDPAILAAPVIADLEGDGSPELIIAVSYFFDT